ncbi:MAG: GNAT family N-acetyltransferase [Acidimicrobiia bacterium]|nr:GNAT family N-acetyltransferase [Acidimicrobiia bacterium]
MAPDALERRDASRSPDVLRWIADDGEAITGSVDLVARPDNRTFAIFRGATDTIIPLTAIVMRQHAGPIHATGRDSKPAQLEALRHAGFVEELTADAFEVDFPSALSRLQRAWLPSGFRIVSAADASIDPLLTLDNQLRHLVPGTDGWTGDIEWMRSELSESPPYEPAAYLIAVEEATGRYVGLVRVWRNEDGPRLGMVGVLPEFRHKPLAARLLYQSLAAASLWGFEAFTTETALTNAVLHPRLKRFGRSTDRLYQLVLD